MVAQERYWLLPKQPETLAPRGRAAARALSAASGLPRGSWSAKMPGLPMTAARRGNWSREVQLADKTKKGVARGPGCEAQPKREKKEQGERRARCHPRGRTWEAASADRERGGGAPGLPMRWMLLPPTSQKSAQPHRTAASIPPTVPPRRSRPHCAHRSGCGQGACGSERVAVAAAAWRRPPRPQRRGREGRRTTQGEGGGKPRGPKPSRRET